MIFALLFPNFLLLLQHPPSFKLAKLRRHGTKLKDCETLGIEKSEKALFFLPNGEADFFPIILPCYFKICALEEEENEKRDWDVFKLQM